MNRGIRVLLLVLCSYFSVSLVNAQVEKVKYFLKFDTTTCLYNVNIVIHKGTATILSDRLQYNSQISLIVGINDSLEIIEKFLPLENGNSDPNQWAISNILQAPAAQPESDFYAIVPRLAPTSAYPTLNEGDTLKLMSIRVFRKDGSAMIQCGESLRFFENGVDPSSSAPGMQGGDFENGFTIGGGDQLYDGNITTTFPPMPDLSFELKCEEGLHIDLQTQVPTCMQPATFNWSGPAGFSSSDEDVIIFPATIANAGQYSVTVTNNLGCTSVITIDAEGKPDAGENKIVCSGAPAPLVGSPAGGTWMPVAGNPFGANLSSTVGGVANVTFLSSASGEYAFVYGTGLCSDTMKLTIATGLTINITGDDQFCEGGNTNLTTSGGDTYLWSNAEITPSISVSMAGTYTVTVTDAGGCTGTAEIIVTENPKPIADITGPDALCVGSDITLMASGGDTYTWDPVHNASSFTISSAGTYSVTVTDANGCSDSALKVISSHPEPIATISGPNEFCQGTDIKLIASGGVTYTWDPYTTDEEITINSGGSYIVTVTDINGCTSSTQKTIIENPNPIASIIGANSFCLGGSLTLTASGGGSYDWGSTTDASLTITNPDTYIVTVTDSNGCTDTAESNVTLFPDPIAGISGLHEFCDGESITMIATGGVNYNWNTFHAGNVLTVIEGGTYSVTVTDINGCTATAEKTLTKNLSPVVNIVGDGSFCQGGNVPLTASGGINYDWNDPFLIGSDVTVITGGTYEVTVTDINGCTATASKLITENPRPIAVINGDDSICDGFNTTLTASGGDTYAWEGGNIGSTLTINSSGTYTVTVTDANLCTDVASKTVGTNAGALAVISGGDKICSGGSLELTASGGTDFVWSPSHLGPTNTISSAGTYTVTVTDANGCTGSTSVSVTEYANPVASISGDVAFCEGGSVVLTGNGGVSYVWNGSISGNNITVSTPGLVELTVTDINGCTASTDLTIVEHASPIADITGSNEFCEGSSVVITASGGESYDWNDPFLIGSDVTVTTGGTYEVTVTDINGCTATASKLITENPRPTAVISGDDSICDGFNTILTASGGDTYAWEGGNIGSTLTINSSGTYTVTVTDANLCTDVASKTVGTNAGALAVISGGDKICAGGSLELTASGGTDYVWSPSHLGPTNTISSAGTYTVTVTDANGCTGSTSVLVTEYANPIASISGDLSFCAGGSVVLTGNGGVSYLWNGSIVNNDITISTPGLVELIVTDINGCTGNTSVTVVENSSPIADILGNNAFCEGESLTLTATGGDSYIWNPFFEGAINTVTTGGTYEVTVTDINGCTATASKLITENPRPTAVIIGDDSICDGFNTTLTASGGDTYAWEGGNIGSTLTINSSGTYTVTVTDANLCTDVASKTVGTNAGALAVISGGDKICAGGSLELTASGGTSYNWGTSSDATLIVSAAGTYTVIVTDINGCTGSTSVTVTEYANPVASISGDVAFCAGGSVVLTGNGGVSYVWNGSISGNNITVSTPGLVELTVTDINGCTAITDLTIVEHASPIADITGSSEFCEGSSVVLTASGGESYAWNDPSLMGSDITVITGGTYEVTVTDINGCTASASKLITENQRPTAVINGDNEFCEGSSVVLSASGGIIFDWSTTENTQNITVFTANTYTVTITDINNCTSTASIPVNVIPAPNAGLDINLGCLELPGGFAQLFGNGNGIWSADSNNPGSVIMSNVANQNLDLSGFTAEGIYKFYLINDKCEDEVNIEIFQKESAGPDLNINCFIDGAVNLSGSGIGSWTENSNNSGTVNIANIYDPNTAINSFSEEGIYEFIWTSSNCQDTVKVTVGNVCDCPITNNTINTLNDNYCGAVNNISISGEEALPSGGEYRWEYSFNNAPFILANDINNLKDLNVSSLGIGQHRFKRVYTTIDGIICSTESNILLIEVKELPTAYIIGQNAMCEGQDQNLTAYDGAYYLWSYNNETAQSINITQGGIYTVTVTGNNGCESIADISVSVNPQPLANIKGKTEDCDGQEVELTAAGGISYIWDKGQIGEVILVSNSGTSIVTVTDLNGCTSVAMHTVNFLNVPTANITGDNVICAGENTTFTASGGDAYAWSINESTASITVNTAQEYIVTVTDANGCTATASTTLAVTPLPNAGADVTLTCYQTAVAVMSANGVGTWTLGSANIGSATITNPNSATTTVTDFSTNGTYELIWTVNGCSDAIVITVGDDCNCPIIGNIINTPTPSSYCEAVANVVISGQAANPAGGDYEWYYSINGSAFALASGVNNQQDYTTSTLSIGEHRFQRKYTTTSGIICDDLSNIVTINVYPNPIASIIGGDDICPGKETIFTATGGVSYLWSNAATTAAINVNNSDIYSVTVTDINGCQDIATKSISVYPQPTANITGDNVICAGENTTFTASGGDAYAWNTNESTSSITVNTAQEFIVTVTDANGCTATASTTLTVTPLPNAGADVTLTCYQTGVAVMSANSVGTWTLGSGNIGSATITNPNSATTTVTDFSTNGTYELIWTVNGCSDAVVITVGDECNCPIIGNIIDTPTPSLYCESVVSVIISGQAANPASGDYEWYYSFNGGAFALASGVNNQQDYTTSTLSIGEYRFQRKYTTTSGIICDDLSNIVTINVYPNPIASIIGGDAICPGKETIFTATGGVSYLWSNAAITAAINVNNSDIYSVTVTDINGCKDIATKSITVYPQPTANITGDNVICAGENTTFTASGGDAYAWNINESTSSITVNTAQEYLVTVTDANGCTATASTTLTVTPLPNAGADVTLTCYQTGVAVMSANGVGTWTLGSGNIGSATITNPNSATTTVTDFSTNGTYELIWTVNGCSDVVVITVGDDCNCPIIGNIINTPTPSLYCESVSSVIISGQAANPAGGDYEWYYSFNSSAFALASGVNNQQDYTTSTLSIGEHRFQRKYTTATGIICDDLSNIVTINVYPNPTASIIGGDDICPGKETIFTATGGVNYLWSNAANTASINVNNSDIYSVTVTDINGCQDIATKSISVYPQPTANITGDNVICAGENTTFTASGGDAYAWNINESTASITVNTAQEYIVTITDANGCTATASITLAVTPLPNAGADVTLTCYQTGVAVMSANGVGTWTLGSGNIGSATITNPNSATTTVTDFSTNGTYELIWTVNGCSDVVVITVGDDCNCPIIGNIIDPPTPSSYCEAVASVIISGQVANPAGGDYEWYYSFNSSAFALASGVNNQQDYTTSSLSIGEHRFQRKYTTTSGIICDDLSNIVTINVYPNPIASIIGGDDICPGKETIFTATGGVNYLWSNAANTASINVNNSDIYSVTVTDINGCQDIATKSITVYPQPTANIIGDNVICAGENTTFTASGGDAYAWNINESSASITVNTAQEFIVTVTDANGCTATASTTLTVTPLPNAGADVTLTCYQTGVAVMSANGVGTWTLGSGNIGSATITNPNSATTTVTDFSTNGTYELIWTVNGCSDAIVITVGDDCNCPIIGNIINTPTPSSYCESVLSVIISGQAASPAGGDYEWYYSFNSSAFALASGVNNQQDYTTSTLSIGEHRFQRKYTTTSGIICDDLSNIVTINVYPNPIASIIGGDDICPGKETIFTATGGVNYVWSNAATTAAINVNNSDIYSVTVTDINGCQDIATKSVMIYPQPTANIIGDNVICVGENTTFTASGGDAYAWNTNESSASITVNTAQEYIVTVTDANGCTATASTTLTVTPLPNAGADVTLTCYQTGVAVMSANGVGTWTLGSGNIGSATITNPNSATTTVTDFSTNGTYELIWTVNGCSDAIVITVGDDCNCPIIGNTLDPINGQYCNEATNVNISASMASPAGGLYEWEYSYNMSPFAPIALSNSNSLTTQVLSVGNHRYRRIYSITGSMACADTSNIISLRVNPNPIAIITGSDEICTGSNAEFTATGGTSYIWSLNNETTNKLTVTTAGTYTVTITDANGCQSEASKTLTVTANPIATITGDRDICEGESTTLTAVGGDSYIWDDGSTDTSITISNAKNIGVTVTDINGCKAVGTAEVTVNPNPIAIITGSDEICTGSNAEFTATGGTSYIWSLNNETTNKLTVTTAGTYTVTITDANGCQSEASKTLTVTANPIATITGDRDICEGESTILTAEGNGTFVWHDGSTSSSIQISSNTNASVTITDASGCKAIGNVNVVTNPKPIASISGDLDFCEQESTVLTASGGTNYIWRHNNEIDPTATITDPGIYTVAVIDQNGCRDEESVVVIMNTLPNASITGTTEICEGTNTEFIASGGVSYSWSNGLSTQAITVNLPLDYTVTVTDLNGCKSSATIALTINNSPIAVINGNTEICRGDSSIISVNGGSEYLWSNGNTAPFISINDDQMYFVTVTDANGCKATGNVSLTINELPTATISGDNAICEGQSTELSASGGVEYLWQNNSTSQSLIVSKADNYIVKVTDENGCQATNMFSLIVNPTPNGSISGLSEICEGQTAILTASGGLNYNWNNNLKTSNINVNSQGTYTVTVTDMNGCEDVVVHSLNVNPLPNVILNGDTEICDGDNTIITVEGDGTYLWSNQSTAQFIKISDESLYTVTVTDNKGCSSTQSIVVSINSLPNAMIQGANEICEDKTTTLLASGGINYQWENGQNGSQILVAKEGMYLVTVTDNNGCTKVASHELKVNPLPMVVISGDTEICDGDVTFFVASGGVDYKWSNNQTGSNMRMTEAGIYTVTVTDAKGCTAEATNSLIINPLPQVSITGDHEICLGSSANLYATAGASYSWSNGNTSKNIQVVDEGLYQVTVTDDNGCNGTSSFDLDVVDTVESPFDLVSDPNPICIGDTVRITINGRPNAIYSWATNNTNAGLKISNANHNLMIPEKAGIYKVMVSQKHEKCQIVSEPAEFEIKVNTLPRVSLGRDTIICELDGGVTLKVADYPEVRWNTGYTGTEMYVENKGKYTVEVMDENGCENKDEITIKEFCCKIYHPNIINLNSYTGNDNFKISHSGCVISSTLSIFDRWGNQVYVSNDGLLPWDGTFKGNPVELGVYVFIFTYKALDEDDQEFEESVTGDVTVIR
jgi:hypothetical protein